MIGKDFNQFRSHIIQLFRLRLQFLPMGLSIPSSFSSIWPTCTFVLNWSCCFTSWRASSRLSPAIQSSIRNVRVLSAISFIFRKDRFSHRSLWYSIAMSLPLLPTNRVAHSSERSDNRLVESAMKMPLKCSNFRIKEFSSIDYIKIKQLKTNSIDFLLNFRPSPRFTQDVL